MTDPKKYWLTDGEDGYAVVAGAEERDRWVPLGWTETDEPTDGWVPIWRDGIEQPGRVPLSAVRELWGPMGWVVGPPPGGVHPATPEPPAAAAAEPKPKSAAGGDAKKE
jgi:hypothetical protein